MATGMHPVSPTHSQVAEHSFDRIHDFNLTQVYSRNFLSNRLFIRWTLLQWYLKLCNTRLYTLQFCMHGWYQTLNISIHNMKDNIQIPPYGLTINIGAEADFIKIFVLNSHKDKGGKKTASRTTRLPRLFIMIRLSKVRRICCYKTIFSYISFTFCHGFAVVPCNSGRNLWMYICLFHHANQVRFLMSFIWISI